MHIKSNVDPTKYPIGVVVSRFQVKDLHEGQLMLIDDVLKNHRKVILFLGISITPADNSNPMDFATRKAMVQTIYPDLVILPLLDIRDDFKWSQSLDRMIGLPFGEQPAVLYGSRDSFLPHYMGKHETIEFVPEIVASGTEQRKQVVHTVLPTSDFRAGVMYSVESQRAVTYPTVDVVAYREDKQILLAKKPNEALYRFIGGFVDRTDLSYDFAAKREFAEETSGSEIDVLEYIASGKINDWRYAKSKNGIMTTLFAGKFIFGKAAPSDDIATLAWVDPFSLNVDTDIMEEHRDLYRTLLKRLPAIFATMEKQEA